MADEVKNFYNKFAKESLAEDFTKFNKRQYSIKKLIDQFAKKNSSILEIGCGAGIITKHLLTYADKLIALDISSKNIEISQKYVNSPRVSFFAADVLNNKLDFIQNQKFDLILMADVIEHIPKESHANLFKIIEEKLNINGLFILSYPSPEYQQYLLKNKPEIMQIIDQEIELSEITSKTNLKTIYFSYKNIWSESQYIHMVLKKNIIYSNATAKENILNLIRLRSNKYYWFFKNIPFRKKLKRLFDKG
jgi:trans-aconitate 2-methyltransferase